MHARSPDGSASQPRVGRLGCQWLLKVLKTQHFVLSGAAGAGAGAGVGVGAGAAAGTVFGPVAFTPFAAGAGAAAGAVGAVGVVAGAFLPFATCAGAGAVGVVVRAFPPFAAGAGTGGDLEAEGLEEFLRPLQGGCWR
jgi:hypothetical protein